MNIATFGDPDAVFDDFFRTALSPVLMLFFYVLIPINYAMWKREVNLLGRPPNSPLPFINILPGYNQTENLVNSR